MPQTPDPTPGPGKGWACTVEPLTWDDQPLGAVSLPGGELRITLGLGSGLTRRPGDPPGRVWALGDRGPNLKPAQVITRYGAAGLAHLANIKGARVLPMPGIGPALSQLQVTGDTIDLIQTLVLRTPAGDPLPGLPPFDDDAEDGERLFDLTGRNLGSHPDGADTEGVVILADGTFWIAEEYGPSLLRIEADGVVRQRWTPESLTLPGAACSVDDCLPAMARRRRSNRGFEGIAPSPDETRLHVAFQSALNLPGEDAMTARLWTLDARTGALVAEHLYPFDAPETFRRDVEDGAITEADLKIGELLCLDENRLLVLERVSHTSKIYAVDLSVATDTGVLAKTLILDTDAYPQIAADLEGMVMLSDTELLLVNDNDFGVEGVATRFFRVRFDQPLSAAGASSSAMQRKASNCPLMTP